jgi:hypothetical protein
MSTISPNAFPINGQRPVTNELAMQRMQALSHQLPSKLGTHPLYRWAACALLSLGLVALSACDNSHETTWAVSYGAVNHTDKNIVSIVINDKGGILTSPAYGAGNAGVCCVIVPVRWKPGLTVTINWQEDSKPKLDAQGNEMLESGVPVLIASPWKTKTVPVPQYKEEGDFFVFFFPNDDVKVAMTSSPEWDEWYRATEEDLKHDNRVKRP